MTMPRPADRTCRSRKNPDSKLVSNHPSFGNGQTIKSPTDLASRGCDANGKQGERRRSVALPSGRTLRQRPLAALARRLVCVSASRITVNRVWHAV